MSLRFTIKKHEMVDYKNTVFIITIAAKNKTPKWNQEVAVEMTNNYDIKIYYSEKIHSAHCLEPCIIVVKVGNI